MARPAKEKKMSFNIIPGYKDSHTLARKDNPNVAEANADFDDMKEKAKKRDGYQCQGCGLKVSQTNSGLHVHHKDFNHEHNILENFVTLCVLCHGVLHLGNFSRRYPNMRLVWLPEISQAELNLMTWAMGVAIKRDDGKKIPKGAAHLAELIVNRPFPANWPGKESAKIFSKQMLNEKAANPVAVFCNLLAKINYADAKVYAQREKWLAGLRIFYDPRHEVFQNMNELETYSNISWEKGQGWEDSWQEIYQSLEAKIYINEGDNCV